MDPRKRVYGIEWATLALICLTYGAWVVLTLQVDVLPVWALVTALTLVLVLHSSLQHEAIHGHPFPHRPLSEAVMTPGLGLAIPFGRFRDLHLLHHKDANLTDPYDDPESNYYDPPHYAGMSPLWRRVLVFNNTLLGRFLIGPAIGMHGFLRTELQLIRAGSTRVTRQWLIHGASVLGVLAWLVGVAGVPLWAYLLSAYLALSVLKIRTFVEHQAHALASGRSVIIEDRGPLAFLFLNNNLHSVHHAHPGVAWYDLPRLFRYRREAYLKRNRGYYFPSYGAVARAYLLRPKDPVPHPLEGG
ncbi:fatty acid desaturase [Oceanibium sediminis]|uniref:fatty acid desaturase n=1 Tax=Oceanibium sediminis TaxID=2026339 RepID=UPI000DD42B7E|nr:fatty acid desaturase [Oceanibium sediminis]